MSIKVAIFDLDATLIDTQVIKNKLIDFLKDSCGFSKEQILEIYKEARNYNGQNTLSLERLEEVLKTKKYSDACFNKEKWEDFKKWFEDVDDTLLIRGVKKILPFLKENKVPIYILTLGVKKWQLDKIRKAGLDKFFMEEGKRLEDSDNIKYTVEENVEKGKIEEINKILKELQLANTEDILFFNDRPDETLRIMEKFREMKVIIRREARDSRYTDEDYEKLKNNGAKVFEDLDILEELNKFIAKSS